MNTRTHTLPLWTPPRDWTDRSLDFLSSHICLVVGGHTIPLKEYRQKTWNLPRKMGLPVPSLRLKPGWAGVEGFYVDPNSGTRGSTGICSRGNVTSGRLGFWTHNTKTRDIPTFRSPMRVEALLPTLLFPYLYLLIKGGAFFLIFGPFTL
jgi:hypothetical protein